MRRITCDSLNQNRFRDQSKCIGWEPENFKEGHFLFLIYWEGQVLDFQITWRVKFLFKKIQIPYFYW